ncbi:putative abc transporter protein [Gigaspora margarita]|uniref:Putative abc transporter protein n=1 Tax=Gigaspora margarita TaxID=4874 RepID=A0A8H4B0S6_GIGMA|nr:putative abc transporter protein [Gigaspora margarita]
MENEKNETITETTTTETTKTEITATETTLSYKVKNTSNGVKSSDPAINHDSKALRQFFNDNNGPPVMNMKIQGWHKEKSQELSGKSYKNIYTTVIDFEVTLDLSGYILPTAEVIASPSFDEYLEAYIGDENKCKEIILKKTVLWEYDLLYKSILDLARRRGYRYNLSVTYPQSNLIVKAMTDHSFGKNVRTYGFIAAPISWLYKKKFDKLQSQFKMNTSASEWFTQNSTLIEQYITTDQRGGRVVS